MWIGNFIIQYHHQTKKRFFWSLHTTRYCHTVIQHFNWLVWVEKAQKETLSRLSHLVSDSREYILNFEFRTFYLLKLSIFYGPKYCSCDHSISFALLIWIHLFTTCFMGDCIRYLIIWVRFYNVNVKICSFLICTKLSKNFVLIVMG